MLILALLFCREKDQCMPITYALRMLSDCENFFLLNGRFSLQSFLMKVCDILFDYEVKFLTIYAAVLNSIHNRNLQGFCQLRSLRIVLSLLLGGVIQLQMQCSG